MRTLQFLPAIVAVLVVATPAASGSLLDQPPAPMITSGPPALTSQTSATFEFTHGDAAATFECQLDGAGFSSCASPAAYPGGIADGSHTFEVRAVEAPFSDPSTPASYTWTIDTQAPTAPTIKSITPPSPSSDNTPTINGTADAGSTVQLYSDGSCATPIGSSAQVDPSGEFHISVTVPENATTTFSANATDAAQNVSDCSNPVSYTEDSLAPTAPTIKSITPPSPSSDNTPTINGTAEPGSTVQLYSDGGCSTRIGSAAPSDASGAFHITVSVPQNATTTFSARARDAAGNVSSCSSPFSYTEDSTPPPPPVVERGPTNPSGLTTAHFEFAHAEPDVTFLCQLDASPYATCSRSQDFSVGDGSHTVSVKAVDAAGNISVPSSPYTWVVDTLHPLVTLTATPPLLTNQTSATFVFGSIPPALYECQLDGAGFSPCTSPSVYRSLPDGSHTFEVRAPTLGALSTSYTWRIDTVAPQTAIASGPPAESKSAGATFAFTSSEAGSSFSCSLDGSGFTLCASPQTYSGLGDGSHVFRVQAVDPAGNADASAAGYAWTISGVGPETIDHTPPRNVSKVRRSVGYGRLQLRWRRPSDSDFDHVEVYVSTSAKSPPRTLVYRGRSQTYTKKRFKNGLYYRYRIVSVDHLKNASKGAMKMVPPSALLKSPRDGRVVHSPPVLRWTPVRKATFYNVQVYRLGEKILSAWPTKPRRVLARRWAFSGRRFALRRGFYVWYVWPGFGPKAKSRYGQLLGQGTFKVR